MKEIILSAKKRELSTKGAVNQLRRDKCVPGIFYIKGSTPISISVHENALRPFVYTAETHLVKLEIEEIGSFQAILKDIQFDPVSEKMIHFDLLGLNAEEKLEIQVPIMFTGQAVGIRDGGVLQQHLHKIDIECLPKDIPDHIVIDITELKIGGSIHIKDVKLENVTIKNHSDVSIVAVTIPRAQAEAVAEPGAAVVAQPEIITKGKVEDEE